MNSINLENSHPDLHELAKQVRTTGEAVRLVDGGEAVADIVPIDSPLISYHGRMQAYTELKRLRTELSKSSSSEIRAQIAEGRR